MPKLYSILIIIVLLLVIAVSTYLLSPTQHKANVEETQETTNYTVKVAVVVDNYDFNDYESTWGISVLVEIGSNYTVLFDTGPSPRILRENLAKLGYSLSDIDCIVISHEHHDHYGGLEAFKNMGLRVYVPLKSSENLKNYVRSLGLNVIEVNDTLNIIDNVYVIGELYGPPWEQGLAVNVSGRGLVIIVGCAHPGILSIVKKAYKDLHAKPYIVLGGFHLAGASEDRVSKIANELAELVTYKIYPIHCSGDSFRRFLEKHFPKKYGDGHVGLVIRV